MSKFIPNSFQTPNLYADQYMAFLTANEWKVLSYAIRRIFGFQKKTDRISISQFCNGIKSQDGEFKDYGTGLGKAAVMTATKALVDFNLLVIVSTYDKAKNLPPKYALQLDSEKVNLDLIIDRYESRKSSDKERAKKARAGIKSDNDPILAVRQGVVYPSDKGYSDRQTYNNQKKTSRKTDSSANAETSSIDDFFGNQSTNQLSEKKEKKPRKKSARTQNLESLERAFSLVRGKSLPDWGTEKQARANQEAWRKPCAALLDECNGNVEQAKAIIEQDVREYLQGEQDPRYPMVEPRSFKNRWLARAISQNTVVTVNEPEPLPELPQVISAEKLQELRV